MRCAVHGIRAYLQPAFLICVLVLGAAGTLIRGPSIPPPRPLEKSLDVLDENGLGPYKVVDKSRIVNPDILRELGTNDYIQWVLEDSEVADSPVKKFLLFVTYYERPDRVPHVPEECYTGGGFQRLESENVIFKVTNDTFERRINGKYLLFGPTSTELLARGWEFPVLYFFRVNQDYAGNRNEARIALNRNLLLGRPSYFCKVELVFNQQLPAPSKEQAVAAGEKLLAVVLPILEEEHWPDGKRAVTDE